MRVTSRAIFIACRLGQARRRHWRRRSPPVNSCSASGRRQKSCCRPARRTCGLSQRRVAGYLGSARQSPKRCLSYGGPRVRILLAPPANPLCNHAALRARRQRRSAALAPTDIYAEGNRIGEGALVKIYRALEGAREPRRRAVDARIINRVDYQRFSYEIFEMLVPRSNCLTGSGSPSVRRDENPTHYFSSLLTTLLVAI